MDRIDKGSAKFIFGSISIDSLFMVSSSKSDFKISNTISVFLTRSAMQILHRIDFNENHGEILHRIGNPALICYLQLGLSPRH